MQKNVSFNDLKTITYDSSKLTVDSNDNTLTIDVNINPSVIDTNFNELDKRLSDMESQFRLRVLGEIRVLRTEIEQLKRDVNRLIPEQK